VRSGFGKPVVLVTVSREEVLMVRSTFPAYDVPIPAMDMQRHAATAAADDILI
jgi:hypothetical protein